MALTFDCRGEEVPELVRKIQQELYENLNIYKRVEGNYDRDPDANDELYDEIFSNERLEELGKISGYHYATWGSHNEKGKYFGFNPETNKRVPWGIRFSNSHREWRDTADEFGIRKERGMKQIKGSPKIKGTELSVWAPQIAVTVIPPQIYNAITLPGNKGGRFTIRIGKNWRPSPAKVSKLEEWHKPTTVIYPLRVYLPVIGRRANFTSKSFALGNVVPRSNSRHFEEECSVDPEVEQKKSDAIIRMGHELGEEWLAKYGPEIFER